VDEIRLADFLIHLDPGPVPVGWLEKSLVRTIGAETQDLLLSDYTRTKQRFRHKEVGFEEYRKIPLVLREGYIVRESEHRRSSLIFCFDSGEGKRCYKLSIKATRNGTELYVLSFHPIWPREMQQIYRRAASGKAGTLIREHKSKWRNPKVPPYESW